VAIEAGIYAPSMTSWLLGITAVVRGVFNGTSSTIGLNKGASSAPANTGTNAGNGYTLGSRGSTAGLHANATWSETLIRSAADADALQLRIAAFEMRRWGIS
jgi:hypothetical protein